MAGVNVPLLAAEHFYVVTDASPDIPRNLPVLRVPDECAYVKEEAGKLLVGFFEPKGKPLHRQQIPEDAEFLNLPDDWDHLAPRAGAGLRAPADPEAHRPPHLLQRPGELHAGRPLGARRGTGPAQFLRRCRLQLDRHPDRRRRRQGDRRMDGGRRADARPHGRTTSAAASPSRATRPTSSTASARRSACTMPTSSRIAAPPDRARRAHHAPARAAGSARRLLRRGGRLGARRAGSCPRRPAPAARRPEYRYGWERQNWFDYAAAEHKAVRTGVGLFDLSPFGKIRVEGRDAEAVLQHICANDVAVAPGRIVYTQWLNRNGGIEADLTVSRLSDARVPRRHVDRRRVLRDLAWLKRHIPDDAHCVATDVTAAEACLAVMGPQARASCWRRSGRLSLDNDALPVRHMARGRDRLCGWPARIASPTSASSAGRSTSPADMARHVFDTLDRRAAPSVGLCGSAAPTRSTAAAWRRPTATTATTSPHTDHVLEAGPRICGQARQDARGRFGDFIGREAVLQPQAERPPSPARAVPARRSRGRCSTATRRSCATAGLWGT